MHRFQKNARLQIYFYRLRHNLQIYKELKIYEISDTKICEALTKFLHE